MSRITKNSFLHSYAVPRQGQSSFCILSAIAVARTNNSCLNNSQSSALPWGFRHTYFKILNMNTYYACKIIDKILLVVPFITQLPLKYR
jgi:hypothetical protein